MSKDVVVEDVAQDFVVFGESAPSKVKQSEVSQTVLSESVKKPIPKVEEVEKEQEGQSIKKPVVPEIDPITAAIREQILIRQMQFMKDMITKEIPEIEREDFQKMNMTQLNAYLREHGQSDHVLAAMAKPEFSQGMNAIEVEGYKKIHTQFKENYQDLTWDAGPSQDSRTKEVKGPDGTVLANLTETTHKQDPVTITLADGTEKTVDSYRTVDFPKELESKKGPLHLSMAVKDSNGKNIAANKAVYFSAHYDENGKLTELSSPQPIKFAGTGPDAIGYIERDGEIYTLAVTQGKYKEMVQEVAKNQGMAFDISQQVETVAQDKIVVQEKVSPIKEKPKELHNDPLIEDGPGLKSQKPKTPTAPPPPDKLEKPKEVVKPQVEVEQQEVGVKPQVVPQEKQQSESLLDQIKQGKKLKPVTEVEKTEKPKEVVKPQVEVEQQEVGVKPQVVPQEKQQSESLLDQIKQGKKLKPVTEVEKTEKPKEVVKPQVEVEQQEVGVKPQVAPQEKQQSESLLDQIKQGKKLKPVTGVEKTEKPKEVVKPQVEVEQQEVGVKPSLLDQIKQGKKLKHVTEAEKTKTVEKAPTGMQAILLKGLASRGKAVHATGPSGPSNPFEDLGVDDVSVAVGMLTDIIKQGDPEKVTEALKQIAEGADWDGPDLGSKDFEKAYNTAMDFAKEKPKVEQDKIHRAAAKVTEKAGVKAEQHVSKVQENAKHAGKAVGKGI